MIVIINTRSGHRETTENETSSTSNILNMERTINRIGFYSGILAFAFAITYCVVQILQLYDVVKYPTDEILIFSSSLLIVIPFLLEIMALHYFTPDQKKFWSHSAVVFTTIYATMVSANYIVQLATVIPMTLKDRLDEVRVLQQTPHSLFWDLDALGYIFMGLATAIAIPVFKKEGIEKWTRIAFIANAAITPLIVVVYFYPTFSYRLLLLGFPWAITAPASMLCLALLLKRKVTKQDNKPPRSRRSATLVDVDDAEEY